MSISTTNREITDARDAIQALGQKDLPIRVSVQVAKLGLALSEPFQIMDEVRNGLIDKYGQEQEWGGKAVVFPDDLKDRDVSPEYKTFVEKMDELLDQEVEVDVEVVMLPDTVDDKPFKLEPFILIALDKFVKVE